MTHGCKAARTFVMTLVGAAIALESAVASSGDELVAMQVSALKVRGSAVAAGGKLTLADVLDFSKSDPALLAAIGEKPVSAAAERPTGEVTHEVLVARLRELGVNMARVTVSGSLACRVEQPAPAAAKPDDANEVTPLVREGAGEKPVTLADAIRAQIADQLAPLHGEIDVNFEAAGREFLELTTPPFEFAIRGPRGAQLGVQEFSVSIRRDGRMVRAIRIGAIVKMTRKVVVASKAINVGTFIRPDSLELSERTFSSNEELGIEQSERLVGQQAAAFLQPGQIVRLRDIKAVDLVKRSQSVTVIGDGAIQLRLTGVALDSGGYGETVRIGVGDKKGHKREVRGTVTGVATVKLITEESL